MGGKPESSPDVVDSLGRINSDLSFLSESVAAVVAWCREAEATGTIPDNYFSAPVWTRETHRIHSERSVLESCLQQLDGADDIDALRSMLGIRIEALTERLEGKDGSESTGNTEKG